MYYGACIISQSSIGFKSTGTCAKVPCCRLYSVIGNLKSDIASSAIKRD